MKGINTNGVVVKRLSGELKSSLTAAKLKALCILNDLSTSGNKSDLINRLLDAGINRNELGLESMDDIVEETLDTDNSESLN